MHSDIHLPPGASRPLPKIFIMSTPDIQALVAQLQLQVVDGAFQAELNGRHFKIQPRLHETLTVLKQEGIDPGCERLMERWGVAPAEREAMKADLLARVAGLAGEPTRRAYIHTSITVMAAPLVQRLASRLAGLFAAPLVWAVSLLTALVLGDLFIFHQVGGTTLRSLDLTALDLAMGYACIVAVLLFHELGHAAGMRHVGQQPQEIGFGFYLIFPVFFANVSNAWLVDRRARFVVNLGGIYFQMLAAVVLYAGIALTSGHTQAWLTLAFKSNLATAIFVLIPFIRNDGYWLLADFLGLHDLYQRAGGMCWIIFQRLRNRLPVTGTEWFIAGYAICNYLFLCFVTWGLFKSTYISFSRSIDIVSSQSWQILAFDHPRILFSSAVSLILLFFFARPFLMRAYSHVKSRTPSP